MSLDGFIEGASTVRQCLDAGLADELQIDIMPVLLGGGLRLFDGVASQKIALERVRVLELSAGGTHMQFRTAK